MAYTISRTECWQRYYVVDFGLSRLYDNPPFKEVIRAGDNFLPEYKQAWCHPFRTDICFVGNLLRIQFILRSSLLPKMYFAHPQNNGRGNHKPLLFIKP
jgi:hypothetical protein